MSIVEMDAVEYVSRAICDSAGYDPDEDGTYDGEKLWMYYRHLAVASIKACNEYYIIQNKNGINNDNRT